MAKLKRVGNIMPVHILLIEDSAADVRLTREALLDMDSEIVLQHLADGEQAINYIQDYKRESLLPSLILLDVNLPKKSGIEVLRELKKSAVFAHIPVIVLSTSRSDEDIKACYEYKANCYISKPVEFSAFVEVVKSIEKFWLDIACIPEL